MWQAPSELGGSDLIAPQKLHNTQKHECCTNALKSQLKQTQFSHLMKLLSFQKYSGVRIFVTSKVHVNKNWFKK